MTAGIEAGVGLAFCMLTAHWLACDLRRPAEGRARPRSWAGTLYRLATASAAWGSAAYLLSVSVPRLHPALAEGFWSILGPGWTLAIASSFLALTAGLSARGVAGPVRLESIPEAMPPRALPAWAPRLAVGLAKLVAACALAMLILAAIAQIRGGDSLPWYAPYSLSSWIAAVANPLELTTPKAIYFDPDRTPDALFLFAGAILVLALALRFLLGRRGPCSAAPIDRIGRDPRLVGRFLGAWVAMTGVILALFPAFFLAGMAALHLTLKAYR